MATTRRMKMKRPRKPVKARDPGDWLVGFLMGLALGVALALSFTL